MSRRPGETVEGITVPEGDPTALSASARQLEAISQDLSTSSTHVLGMPSLMGGWAGPSSSAFAQLTGHEGMALQWSSSSVWLASLQVQSSAETLAEAQRAAQRAIVRALRARDEINEALRDIKGAEADQRDAEQRKAAAAAARQIAEAELVTTALDVVGGGGLAAAAAAAAADAAAAEEAQADRDLERALLREGRARRRLEEAREGCDRPAVTAPRRPSRRSSTRSACRRR